MERLKRDRDHEYTPTEVASGPLWERTSVHRKVSSLDYRLADGALLAQRFRIVRWIASGGMGDVYEAWDKTLNEAVAIKTLRHEVAEDPQSMARFRREILFSRKVTHRNVCRIFEIFSHSEVTEETQDDTEDEIPHPGVHGFLTMELLRGPNLSDYLRSSGPLATEEALPLVRQMVQALAAAHDAGVIHRDFKCVNVILVKGSQGQRAVVTDFGIALAQLAGAPAARLTGDGEVLGSPQYMAPEQAEGEEVTAAADIHALGVVMFRMVTGRMPFEGPTSLAALMERLEGDAPSPRTLVPDLDRRWETVILKCLERLPEDRFQSVAEIAAELEPTRRIESATGSKGSSWAQRSPSPMPRDGLPQQGADLSPPPVAPAGVPASSGQTPHSLPTLDTPTLDTATTLRPWAFTMSRYGVVGALVMVLMLAAWGLLEPRDDAHSGTDPVELQGLRERPAVAVLGFENLSGQAEVDWLSTTLAELLSGELAMEENLRLVSGESLARLRQDLKLDGGHVAWTAATREKIERQLHNDYLVQGTYAVDSVEFGKLQVEVRLRDMTDGTTLTTWEETFSEPELLTLVERLGGALRRQLVSTAASYTRSGTSLPANVDAARLYVQGLEALRTFEMLRAQDLLLEAAVADADFPLIHAALAEVYATLGYEAKAQEAIDRAFVTSAGLPLQDRLQVEGAFLKLNKDWDGAIEVLQTLADYFPDDLEYGLDLVQVLKEAGRPAAALETLDYLRCFSDARAKDPRIDMHEAEVAGMLSKYPRALMAADRALQTSEQKGARLLAAHAQRHRSVLLWHLGRFDESEASALNAQQALYTLGDLGGSARARLLRGNVHYSRGEPQEALAVIEDALIMFRQIGFKGGELAALSNQASVLYVLGEADQAKELYRESVEIGRQLGAKLGTTRSLYNYAVMCHALGEADKGINLAYESLAMARQLNDQHLIATQLAGLARMHSSLDLAKALEYQTEAGDIFRRIDDNFGLAFTLSELAQLTWDQDRLPEAQRFIEEALEINTSLGAEGMMLENKQTAAWIAVSQGRWQAAEDLAGQVETMAMGMDRSVNVSNALTLFALVHLERQDMEAARQTLDRALELAAANQQAGIRVGLAMIESKVLLAEGQVNEARGRLESSLRLAQEAGRFDQELEVRLELGKLELSQGLEMASQQRLATLEREARERGFLYLARLAREAQESSKASGETPLNSEEAR